MLQSRKNSRFAFAALITLALGLTSCVEDLIPEVEPEQEETTQENTMDTSALQFDGGDGICAAVISTTSYDAGGMLFDIEIGTAVSAFTEDNWSTFVDAGAVSCESEALTLQDNNSYLHMFSYNAADPNDLGIDFADNPSWSVAGGNGVPAFNYTTTIDFPAMGALSGDATVDSSSDYTVSIGYVTDADSLIYQVSDVLVTVPATQLSYTFTADEMAGISGGASIVQVTAYAIEETDQSGKTIYFVNERVKSYTVTIE